MSVTEASADVAIVKDGTSYDDMPYTSHPFPQTHPARVAALARICGLDPPEVSRARVLELGSAAGGNLIPMAARLPEATFLGVDLSARQIDEGKKRIERLALRNIELRHLDLTKIGRSDGLFDYIICHGVYSWAPAPVRDAILRICSENLSPTGVALVSYNVLPGWRLRQTMRDALTLSIPHDEPLHLRVAKARQLIAHLAEHTPANRSWGRIFRDEAELLGRTPDDYVAHEFLEECNDPCSFTEFVTQAAKHDLMFFGEAQLKALLPETMLPSAANVLRSLSRNQMMEAQQGIDIFTGRTFRQSLLTHMGQDAATARELSPDSIGKLHLNLQRDFAFREEKDGRALFATLAGANVATTDPSCRRAFEILIERRPGSTTLDQLMTALASEALPSGPDARGRVAAALFNLSLMGALSPSTLATDAAAQISDRPTACPFLRKDVSVGSAVSANLAHESTALDPIARIVLPRLDGSAAIADLLVEILGAARAGTLSFWRGEERVTDPEGQAACAKEHLARVLLDFRNGAMLLS